MVNRIEIKDLFFLSHIAYISPMDLSNITGISDSHTHLLEMKKKNIDIEKFIEQWEQHGGEYLLDIGITPEDFKERRDFRKLTNKLYFSLGIHPNYASSYPIDSFKIIERELKDKYVVALGETGLDFFRGFADKKIQQTYFEKHIYLSHQYNKPLIIHNRDASKEIIETLSHFREENVELRGVIHCFSAGKKELKDFLNMGFYISFAGNLTYKKSTSIQEALEYTPIDRLLIETDSPYLSPQKVRGSLNTPCNIGYTLDYICDKLNKKRVDIIKEINSNFSKLFLSQEN